MIYVHNKDPHRYDPSDLYYQEKLSKERNLQNKEPFTENEYNLVFDIVIAALIMTLGFGIYDYHKPRMIYF